MELENRLAAVPVEQWETKQAIVFDWYDGPRAGICSLANPEGEFFFDLLDERHNPEGLDDRLFRVRQVPMGTVQRALALLLELGHPNHPVWVPVWKFVNPANKQKADQFLEELEVQARPVPMVFASRDLEHFQGWWSMETTNGQVVDWFSTLRVPLTPGA